MRFVTPCMMLETRFEVCDSTCDVKTRYVRFVNPCVMLETLVRFVTPGVMLETRVRFVKPGFMLVIRSVRFLTASMMLRLLRDF